MIDMELQYQIQIENQIINQKILILILHWIWREEFCSVLQVPFEKAMATKQSILI